MEEGVFVLEFLFCEFQGNFEDMDNGLKPIVQCYNLAFLHSFLSLYLREEAFNHPLDLYNFGFPARVRGIFRLYNHTNSQYVLGAFLISVLIVHFLIQPLGA